MDLPDKTSDLGQGVFNTNLKSQREQRERVQGGEANLCSNVGFEKRLVQDIRLRVAIACVNQHSVTVWGFAQGWRGWQRQSTLDYLQTIPFSGPVSPFAFVGSQH